MEQVITTLTREAPTQQRRPRVVIQADVAPGELSMSVLIDRCVAEYERFHRSGIQDTRFAYEIFRRAMVERNDDAWAYIFQQYARLVECWVRRSSAFDVSEDSAESFVCAAFTRFWQAITAERFATFPTVASLLHYLQCCAVSVVIDAARSRQREQAHIIADYDTTVRPDETAIDNVSRADFWRAIERRLRSDAERMVLYRSYVLGEKPAEIFAAQTGLFRNVSDVYAVKRNVLERLARDPELLTLLA